MTNTLMNAWNPLRIYTMAWWSLRDHQAWQPLTECMGIVMSFSKQRFLQAISRGNDHPASESFLPARKLFSKCFLYLFFLFTRHCATTSVAASYRTYEYRDKFL